MAILNGKYTSFDPSVSVVVTGETVYYDSATKFPYTKNFVIKGNYLGKYEKMPMLETLTFSGEDSSFIYISPSDVPNLRQLIFDDETNLNYMETIFSGIDVPQLKEVKFISVGEYFDYDPWAADLLYLESVENIEVYDGWAFNLACYSEKLTAESLEALIDNLADMGEDSGYLSIGEINIAKLSSETIAIATAKGWIVE